MSASFRRKPLAWAGVVFLLALPLLLHSQLPPAGGQPGAAAGPPPSQARSRKPNHAADHVLVRFKPGVPLSWQASVHAAVQAQVLRDYSSIEGLQLVKLPPGLSVEDAIVQYSEQPDVLYAEPDYFIYPTATPNDTRFNELWGLNNTGQLVNGTAGLNDADIDAPEAWNLTTGNSNLVIVTIDTGIDYNHLDLAANAVQLESNCADNIDNDGNGFKDDCRGINAVGGLANPGCNQDPVQCFSSTDPMDGDNEINPGDGIRHHGTRVAGVIGAVGNNGVGVTGVNWNVKLLGCVALSGATGQALVNLVSDAIQCLNYVIATKNVHPELTFVATNNSWATVNFSQPLMDAIDVHRKNGILFIAAADNSTSSNDTEPIFPASYYLPNVISVAATDQNDSLASFSNFGRHTVHLGAPGTNILSTVRTGLASTNDTTCDVLQAYCLGNGTSFSAPYVTGVAALLKAQTPSRDWRAVKNLILAGGDNKAALSSTTITGKRLNANGSLTCSNEVVNQRLQPVADMITASVGSSITLASLHINCAAPSSNVLVDVKNPVGQIVQTLTLLDNGTSPDQVSGDGIFSGTFIPSTADTMSLVFPGNDIVTVRILQGYNCTTPTPNGGCTNGAVPFNYRNIAGTSLNLDDDSSASIAPPFQIQFGNLAFNTVTVNGNGNLSLTGTPALSPDNVSLPDSFEDTLVAPWWDDLRPLPGTAQNVFWDVAGSSPSRELIIEWRDVPHFGSATANCPTTETVKFQVVFFESNNDILFNYADTVFGATCQSILAVNDGASATVGVQVAPTAAKQFSFNSAQLSNNKAILWQLASNPAPTLNSMSPTSKLAGSPGFTLTVNGVNFVQNSIVRWKGSDRGTTFVSSGQLTAAISAADIATPGTAQVTVFNPAPGGGTSSALTFTIVTPPPPVLNSISPSNTLVGASQFTLTANGSNFLPGSKVRWNGVDRTTTFASDTQLTALIPASDVAVAGTATVTVFSPAPGGGTSNSQTFTINNPVPTLNNISPTTAVAGSPQFTLTVNGSNFISTSVVQWNSSSRTTTFVNSGQLTATILDSDISVGGTPQVTVFNPGPGGGVTSPQPFTVTNPVPTLTNTSPTSTTAGGVNFTLTVNGSSFVSTSVVRWNGSDRGTTFISNSQLRAAIPASDITTAGTASVTVFSPTPGGGTTSPQTFAINNPVPAVSTLAPTSTQAGGAQFTLTVNGSNFINSSVVRWNGSDRATTSVNSGQLTATILASDIASAGTATVAVFTPTPGGGTSGGQSFTINNPLPVLNNISPTNAQAGGAGFTLTVNGSSFVNGSVVRWNGSDRTTLFVNSGQLTATIPASDIAVGGTPQVTVFNPLPGGGSSAGQSFTVTNPAPTLLSISPTNGTAGGAQFTLTVNGSNFVSTSLVQWNGSPRTTNFIFVNSTQLKVDIPASDIATAGTASVTVLSPTPGGGISGAQTFTINNPLPVLNSISPTNTQAGGAQFTLTVNGSSFVNGSVVRWNGSDRTTLFVNSTQLTATIPAADIATAGTAQVTVFNPAPGGGTSGVQTFTVNNPLPVLNNISPTNAQAGATGFTLTVNGSNFASTSKVRWNGSDRTTTFVNSGQLTATIPAGDIATAGTAQVTVFSPTPGGGTSGAQTFTINNPAPVISSLNPGSAVAGGVGFTLTVNGATFVSGSVVRWNGSDRATTFVNSTQLTAAIPASDIASAGSASVTVFNPAPGGGSSLASTFTINAPPPVVLSSILPASTVAGGAGFTLTVNGQNFLSTSVVRWNGTDRATTFVNSGQLTAAIAASDIAAAGTAQVAVFTPAPVNGLSNALTFSINNPLPVLNNIAPTSTQAGGAGFTLTVTGSSFVNGSVIRWNGADRMTTFVNSGQLTAAIAASDIAAAGTAQVAVFTPAPGGGASGEQTFTINNPLPVLTNISPTNTVLGGAGFTLTVNGSSFVSTSVVRWNGVARTTTFVNSGQLTAAIPASDVVSVGTAQVTVFTPTPGGGASGPQNFTINNPVPLLSSMSPASAVAGGAGFTLTVNGSSFVSGSVVRWNGADRVTTFVNSTQLTAAIAAGDIASAGTAQVTVFTSGPGGGTSAPLTFTINSPPVLLTSILPGSAVAGGAGFTLTVNGANFVNGSSVVRWNGADRVTTFVNSGQLTAAILASDIASAGTAQVTVFTSGGPLSNSLTFNVNNPLPVLSNISPTNTVVGGAGFTLTVNGSSFVNGSVVRWNGSDRTTTFVNGGQLTAAIPASDIATAGTAQVTVFTAAPGGGASGAQTFTINNPLSVLTNISPTNTVVGGAGLTLTVNGSSFVNGSVVRWNGSDRTTTFVNGGQLTAAIPASDIASTGTASVTVFSPTPGGGLSGAQTFTINNPVPLLNSMSPTSAVAGGAGFTLTLNGSSFVNGSVVRWNGANRTTAFVNSTELTATIPNTDITTAGTAQVTVFTAAPGGGTSTPLLFTINAPPPVTITSIVPDNAVVGGAGFTLTVNGTNFVGNGSSVVRWNGTDRTTVFGSSTQLMATIPASDITTAGTAQVTVFTSGASTCNCTSNSQTFTINNPLPVLSNISPISMLAGGGGFTLTVNGSSFVNGSVVRWNGSGRTTTFVNSGQLTAAIPASDTATVGTAQVTVFTPSPGGGTSGAQTFTINNPLPVLNSILPTNAVAGGAGFTLTVNGSNFVNGLSVVRWNGADRTTTFVNGGQLTATIPGSDIATAGTAQVTVFTSGSGSSNSQAFAINNPPPVLSTIVPANTLAGGAQFTLTVNGSSFVNGSVVRWNGSDRTTTLVNGGQLTATIPASDIATAGTASVTVLNPGPGGGISAAQSFTINNPLPALASILPTNTLAGGAAFTLTVNGSNFVNGSVVHWNGTDRTTTFVNNGQLTATILAADVAAGGTAQVSVFNPVPGGGTSNSQTFTVNNPIPALSSAVPDSAPVGTAGLTLTVNGSGFVVNSVVQWNGGNRATAFVSANQVQVTIPASDLVNAGPAAVRVVNPAPGGGTSGSANVTLLSPSITDVQPNTVPATSPAFDLIVTGTNFHTGSVVRWKGSDRATVFMSPTQLKATILASDVANPGLATVTVFNSAGTGGTSNGAVVTVSTRNPFPTVTGLLPAGVTQGSGAFTLTVIGSNFVSNSAVNWNGSPRTTVFLSSGLLQASILASDILGAGTATVTVFTPSPGGGLSNGLGFPILAMGNPAPSTTAIMPNTVVAGSVRTSLTLTVMGANFKSGSSVVRWNGMDRTTMFVSANQLTATLPASDVAAAGTAQVTVFTPVPGGGTSNGQTFTIQNPVPTTSSLSPSTAVAGSVGFTLVVVGANFVPGSVVQWNGLPRVTTYVGNSQLRAAIPASDIAVGGTPAQVTVFTAGPGGGVSNPSLPFSVTMSSSSSSGSSSFGEAAKPASSTQETERTDAPTVEKTSVPVEAGPGGNALAVSWVVSGLAVELPRPEVESLSPETVAAGTPSFTLIVRGKNFLPGAVIRWNGEDLLTTYIASGELRAALSRERLASAGVFRVTVLNPDPRSSESDAAEFTIQ